MEKLIITATTANSWIYPDVKNWAESKDTLIEDVIQCSQAGAAIVHIHLPLGQEIDTVRSIREQCDVIIQAGMSSYPINERTGIFNAKPDMISIILNHHAEQFTEISVNQLHPLEELQQYCKKCQDFNIKPEWEVWHTGSYWNLRYLINNKLVRSPHILTLFFGWPGGTWSPPTPDEYFHRVKYMPSDCVHTVSVMGEAQTKIAALAIINCGNVRVGTEDYPFLQPGIPAINNAEIVEKFVKLAKSLGREIADSSETRKILGMQLK